MMFSPRLSYLLSLWRQFSLCQCPSHACPNLATCYGWLIIFDGALFLMVGYYQSKASLPWAGKCIFDYMFALSSSFPLFFLSLFPFYPSSISSRSPQPGPITERETRVCVRHACLCTCVRACTCMCACVHACVQMGRDSYTNMTGCVGASMCVVTCVSDLRKVKTTYLKGVTSSNVRTWSKLYPSTISLPI